MRATGGRSRTVLVRLGGAILAVALLAALAPGAVADTKSQLQHAKNRLHVLENQITAQRDRLDALRKQIASQEALLHSLQGELNAMAQRIDDATSRYEQTRQRVRDTTAALGRARARYEALRFQLDQRARYAYEQGPASDLEVVLGASSLADLSDKVEFVNQLAADDVTLANDVQNRANALVAHEEDLKKLQEEQASALADLQETQGALDKKFSEAQSIYQGLQAAEARAESIAADLVAKQKEITGLLDHLKTKLKKEKIAAAKAAAAAAAAAAAQGSAPPPSSVSGPGPFQVCPVGQPHAYGDSFGAPRYAGGYHPHAGNDIMAPRGTPVYAPFSGNAYEDPNGLGGNAFILRGSQGYVYGAHLDSYGTMGNVSAGTVVGYVGDSGDARGGPTHLHFEWHPNVIPSNPYRSVYGYTVIGSAIDPYPYLNQVC